MTIRRTLLAASLAFVALSTSAFADTFETALRGAYADYRAALFQTNMNDQAGSTKMLGAFQEKWSALEKANPTPPARYADDAAFGATLTAVADIAAKAADEVKAGKLADAHLSLEGIRDEIGGMHERNGIIAFSDRMNTYHAKMEEIIGATYADDAAGLGTLREDAAVLAYLAADVTAHPPADAEGKPEYAALLKDFNASVERLLNATRNGNSAAAKAAIDTLKAPYSKLFLKFG